MCGSLRPTLGVSSLLRSVSSLLLFSETEAGCCVCQASSYMDMESS